MSSKSQFTWLQQIGSNWIKLNGIVSGIESNWTVFTLVNRPSLVVLSVAAGNCCNARRLQFSYSCSLVWSFFLCLMVILVAECHFSAVLLWILLSHTGASNITCWYSVEWVLRAWSFMRNFITFHSFVFYILWGKKKETIFVCVHFLMLDRNWWIFFTCIKENIATITCI